MRQVRLRLLVISVMTYVVIQDVISNSVACRDLCFTYFIIYNLSYLLNNYMRKKTLRLLKLMNECLNI